MKPTARFSCVSFPVLPHDLGVERVMDELRALGFRHLMICCGIYTGYRLVMPRNPRRAIYALEEGMQYYRPNQEHYKDTKISPQATRDFADVDMLGEVVKHAHARRLTVGAWLPVFANGRIAKCYPEAAIRNLYGSPDRLFLCYNNPDVLEFTWAMIRDVVEDYRVDVVELDKIPQTLLELNVFSGRLDPIVRFIGSFCFCDHCAGKARAMGFDLPSIRRHGLRLVEDSLKVAPHTINRLAGELQGDAEIPLLLVDEPLMYDLLRLRLMTVREYVRDVRQRVKALNKKAQVSVAFVPPFKIGHDASAPRSWLCGQSYKNIADVVDYINCVIHWEQDVVAYDTRRAANAVAGRCRLDVHVPAYGRFAPDETLGLAETALASGADSVSFFCYDLMTDDMVKSIGRWIKNQTA